MELRVVVTVIWLFLVLVVAPSWAQYSNGLDSSVRSTNHERLIHVAVVVDRNSVKDFLLVLHSAVRSAMKPSLVVLHALACGETKDEADGLVTRIDNALENCLGNNRREVLPFVLPEGSGFKAQMKTNKLTHHWTSPAGADMARFFLPSVFPHAQRILYLDNDIVISCCLEEIFDTDLGENGIVGLTLDDLKWSTSTQFKRHYNSTHPVVIKNMRRTGKKAVYEPSEDQRGDELVVGADSERKPGGKGLHKKDKRAARVHGGKVGLATTAGATLTADAHIIESTAPASNLHSANTPEQHSVKHFRKEFTAAAVGPNEAELEKTLDETKSSGSLPPPGGRKRKLIGVLEKNLHPYLNPREVSEDEFVFHLPRYPNDGVILFDVQRYNIANILGSLEEIAHANGRGEYAVNLGTQQFTVLALWDRWVELSPRANLRHFPDMARGYLMWFLYNGIIHYAGQSKPAVICQAQDGMELRRATYTPWATSLYYMVKSGGSMQCKNPEPVLIESEYANCSRHIPDSETFSSFLRQVKRITAANAEDSSLLIRLGEVTDPGSGAGTHLAEMDRHLLNHASWSWRVFDGRKSRASKSKGALASIWPGAQAQLKADFDSPAAVEKRKKARDELVDRINARHSADGGGHHKHKKEKLPPEAKFASNRGMMVYDGVPVCDGSHPHDLYVNLSNPPSGVDIKTPAVHAVVDYAGNIDPKSKMRLMCKTVLAHLKEQKHAHWDVAGVVVDYDDGGKDKEQQEQGRGSSLGALTALNLHFMRPKFVFCRIDTTAPIPAHSKPQPSRSNANSSAPVRPDTNGYTTAYKIRNDVRKYDQGGRDGAVYQEDDMDQGSAERRALRFLARNGYVAHSEVGGGCGEGFVCVWGLMVTQLELYGF